MEAREIAHAVAHAGRDGQVAAMRTRVENQRIETCPLRDASERDENGAREIARFVQIETQNHDKVS